MYKYKYLLTVLFVWGISICFYLQNLAVPFFADDYKWIGHWQLKHEGVLEDLAQIIQTQWEFCHLENGRLFCHAMVQVLVSWGEPLFDVTNALLFPIVCGAIVMMSFDKMHWKNVLPWLFVVIFMRYLIAEETSLLFWACGSMNYLLPTGMTAFVITLLFKYKPQTNRIKWWYPAVFLFCVLAGWEHEIIVLPVAFAMFVFVYHNFKQLSVWQWTLIIGYCIGALLVLIAPANFNRINGPIGMAENNWIATLAKRLYLVVRFGFVFDVLLVYSGYHAIRNWNKFKLFIQKQYFWLCALGSVFLMGMLLGTDSRMRWGIDIFSLFILLSVLNNMMEFIEKNRLAQYLSIVACFVVMIHQIMLIQPFFESWQTYRDSEQQCISFKVPVVTRVEDWHSDNWLIDAFVAHPYHMLKEDAFVSLPNSKFECKAEVYDYISNMSNVEYENMPEYGIRIGDDYVLPATEALQKALTENKLILHLDKMSMKMDFKPVYLAQHLLLQNLMPSHYPTTTIATLDIAHIVELNNHKFICLDKPFCPVWRDINNVEIKE